MAPQASSGMTDEMTSKARLLQTFTNDPVIAAKLRLVYVIQLLFHVMWRTRLRVSCGHLQTCATHKGRRVLCAYHKLVWRTLE